MCFISYTRVSCVDGTSNKNEYLLETSGVMERKSTAENYGLLGATVIDLKELHRSHPTKRICVWCVSACVCACVCVCVCVCVSTRHVLTCSALNPFFSSARTVDPR